MIIYDKIKDTLVMYAQASTADAWSTHWKSQISKEALQAGEKNYWYRNITWSFLPRGVKVLDGGCGIGQNVYGLEKWGYEGYGVDYASDTIEAVKILAPDLHLSMQDIRKMGFEDSFFDGYWLLGVIEHFWEGYDAIFGEAQRVLRNGGYFFITFPWISPLRRLKIFLGLYKTCPGECEKRDDFYQFFLTQQSVERTARAFGFELVRAEGYDAVKGLKDEIPFLKPFLQFLYNRKGIVARGFRYVISCTFKWFGGHMRLCVFQKLEKKP